MYNIKKKLYLGSELIFQIKKNYTTMKKLTTLSLAIFISAFQFINAQEYHPLIEEGKSWDDIACWFCVVCPDVAQRYYYTGEDTLIDGLVYSKIGSYDFVSVSESEICPPYAVDTVPNPGFRYVHEDVVARRVYLHDNSQPVLLYDFSLEVGDTLISDLVTFSYVFVVEEIDEVVLLNGETRKRWLFDSEEWGTGGLYRMYTEGIGMETGLFGDFIQFEWWSSLSCVQLNNEHLWEDNSHGWGTCWGLVGENEIATEDLQIYPNPASDYIRISTPKNFVKAEVKIFNSLGQLVFENAIQSENTIVDVSDFKRGMYFVMIKSENVVLKEKLMIR